jgi:4-hydroxy-4-methyl-2-oxoglutarate aldolase
MIEASQLQFFARAGAATVYEAYGRIGDLDPLVRAMVPGMAVAGPAFCVQCERGDNLALHRAVAEASAGDVVVVSGHGEACGYLGDILAEAAACRGIAGVVVDGFVRDVAELTKMRFPVWARGLAIRGATKVRAGVTGGPVRCGGVEFAPGDLVVCDDDGVCAVARDDIARVFEATRNRLAQEVAIRDRLRQGALTLDLLDLRKYLSTAGADESR